nr:hypothetical protein [uncultured Draconibacterium sp.]
MKSTVEIELYEEHETVNFYTMKFPNEETETDKFFNNFPKGCKYDEDIDIIINWIDQIGERGAHERYFRPEGKFSDNVWAIPIEKSSLRLYIIRISFNIVIIGNGGIKITSTYNKDQHLTDCVELLQQVDRYLRARLKNGKLSIYQKAIFGDTIFHL